MRNLICAGVLGVMSTSVVFGEELRSGAFYPLETVPAFAIVSSGVRRHLV